jgi:hypothetical protein
MSGGSTSMFRQSTRAALAVLSFPGDGPRHEDIFEDHEGRGDGLPQVRCRLADQYGTMGTGSGTVSTEPFISPLELTTPFAPGNVCVEDGSEREAERHPRSVSESMSEP